MSSSTECDTPPSPHAAMTANPEESGIFSSPMMVATRDYYQNAGSPPPWKSFDQTLQPELQNETSTGRRHSVVDGRLYRQMLDWNLKSAPASRRGSTFTNKTDSSSTTTLSSKDESTSSGVASTGSGTTSSSSSTKSSSRPESPGLEQQQRIFNPLDPRYLGGIPYSFTTAKLQELGHTFLGSHVTADAFVRATPITRRPAGRPRSFPPAPRASTPPSPATSSCTIRVKIIPKLPDRKAFIMQKRFPARPRRHRAAHSGVAKQRASPSEQRSIPIHVEYVAYRAPLLAAILLSGHVRKGDLLEIPIPHPDQWPRVVEWIYTGNIGNINPEERENIEYLGGHID
ncbi:hypothetical protein EDC01DRAFT_237350 [Geopyxis carbonaria]|nr:hypothetical protein EDC01DRAFT_237350 [Geopyxis carbonaria]